MHKSSIYFLSCDWGTSSFRIRLVDAASITVVATWETNAGIAATFRSWQEQQELPRLHHYAMVISDHVQKLEAKAGFSLGDLPLVLSGMASASIGIKELPYGSLPLDRAGQGLVATHLQMAPQMSHDILLVSGMSNGNDVMRGEETQLLGLLQHDLQPSLLVIIPGTHAKHIRVVEGQVRDFATYMTGEFFQLLAQHSILSASVGAGPERFTEYTASFLEGLTAGSHTNLLHAAFGVRINQLLRGMEAPANYHYLSGLLIGAELSGLPKGEPAGICLLGNAAQCDRYGLALAHLYPHLPVFHHDADAALVHGHALLFRKYLLRSKNP